MQHIGESRRGLVWLEKTAVGAVLVRRLIAILIDPKLFHDPSGQRRVIARLRPVLLIAVALERTAHRIAHRGLRVDVAHVALKDELDRAVLGTCLML